MNNLVIDEYPLMVLPKLAVQIGLNEAIVLQQIHYWLNKSTNVKEGYKWIYNSYTSWNEQFPFWGRNTLRRAINSLEKQDLLITGNFNKAGFDKTKWYRINYQKLSTLNNNSMGKSSAQNGQTINPKRANGITQNGQPNTRDYTETSSETNKKHMSNSDEHDDISSQVIDYLNEKADRHFRKTGANKRLINARVKEGFELKDFKRAIDNKVAQWSKDTKMSKYLRPVTLFNASKFEGYVNEQQTPSSTNFNRGLNVKETLPDWARDDYTNKTDSKVKAEDLDFKEGELPF